MTTLAKVLVRIRHRVPIQAGSSTTSGRARHIAPSRATNAGGTSARSGIEQPPERAADPSHQGGGVGGGGEEDGPLERRPRQLGDVVGAAGGQGAAPRGKGVARRPPGR